MAVVLPGMSVTEQRETLVRLSLRRDEVLLLVSDGVQEEALQRCRDMGGAAPAELAAAVLTADVQHGEDDATVVTVRLHPKRE